MIDIIGLVVSTAGLIATLRGELRRDAKFMIIRDILSTQKGLFTIMARVKDIHDQFEAFRQSTADAFAEISQDETTEATARKKLFFILNQEKRIDKRDLPDDFRVRDDLSSLPGLLQDPVKDILFYYPTLRLTLREYAEHVSEIKRCTEECDLGKNYKVTRNEIQGVMGDIVYQADKVLINMIPIIRGFHDELHSASETFFR